MSTEQLRHFANLVESFLTEAPNYPDMFTGIHNLNPESIIHIDTNVETSHIIKVVKTAFKKSDRIVWFLRQWRIGFLSVILNKVRNALGTDFDARHDLIKPYEDLLVKYLKDYQIRGNIQNINTSPFQAVYNNPHDFIQDFKHFFSLPIPEIQNFRFDFQNLYTVRHDFLVLERKWQEKAKDMIPYNPDDGKVIMTFPDGFFWVNLNREYCEIEGNAMGHCGNSASYRSGDQVLSLRRKVKVGKQTYVRPSLTFILHHNGFLGEMKGRANEKPNPKYHPYIVELLKLPMIKGITGGGYAPENNFQIEDLDKATQNELVELKPALLSLMTHYKIFGADHLVMEAIKSEFSNLMFPDSKADYAVIEWYNDIRKPLMKFGDSTTQNIVRFLDGDDAVFGINLPENPIGYMVEKLPYDILYKLIDYIKDIYKDEIEEWEESRGKFGVNDIAEFVTVAEGHIYDSLYSACTAAVETGMQKMMLRYLENEVLSDRLLNSAGAQIDIRFVNKENKFQFDTTVYICVSIKEIIEVLSDRQALEVVENNGWLDDFYFDIDEPYDGFSGFDLDSAIETLYSEMPELKSDKEEDR